MFSLAFIFLTTLITTIALFSKLFFLASGPLGILVLLSNVFYEALFKKVGLDRWSVDLIAVPFLTIAWFISLGWSAALGFVIAYCMAWGYTLNQDALLKNNDPGIQDELYRRHGAPVTLPLPNPRLLYILQGPVLERSDPYGLGDWPLGHRERFVFFVLNPTILQPQFPLLTTIECDNDAIEISTQFSKVMSCPLPGEITSFPFEIRAAHLSKTPANIIFRVKIGSFERKEELVLRSVFDPTNTTIESAVIDRWKGGASAGFAWRGDMDMYDPMTVQSVEGLKHTLGMSRRYRMPSTLYLSGRLSLDKEEHRRFCDQLGVDRETDGIDDFIKFMREEANTAGGVIDFPCETDRQYALEIGNHMYLHYGTHAAMDEGNNWKMNARIGDGQYPWQGERRDSFSEQRDNAVKNATIIKEKLGVTIRSWGVPDRANDEHTSRAVEAAGMEVGSDTNTSAWTNVMMMPPPHHPKGCEKLVELTKKYPGDPDDAYKVAMLKFWMRRARKKRGVFIFMAHHHLLRYLGIAGTHCAEEILRHSIQGSRGDFYISTLLGLGRYWERVLCPQHRWVSSSVHGTLGISIRNRGDERLEAVPVEVTFSGGRRLLILRDLPAGEEVRVSFDDGGAA